MPFMGRTAFFDDVDGHVGLPQKRTYFSMLQLQAILMDMLGHGMETEEEGIYEWDITRLVC